MTRTVPTVVSAFGHRSARRGRQRPAHLLGRDPPRPNVVERSIIRLGHHGIDRADVGHARLLEHPAHHRIGGFPDAERTGEKDRCLELAELPKLRRAGDLPETVADEQRGGQ